MGGWAAARTDGAHTLTPTPPSFPPQYLHLPEETVPNTHKRPAKAATEGGFGGEREGERRPRFGGERSGGDRKEGGFKPRFGSDEGYKRTERPAQA